MKLSEAVIQPSNQPSFHLSLTSYHNGGKKALVRIQASDDPTTEHVPSTFVLTIDESGSMNDAATRHDDSDGASGLSQLDVVKHAARTIIATLADQDRLAIVAFSDTARVVMPLTYMTEQNKKTATSKVDDLRPLYCTNLYDGLHTALELIRAEEVPPANANVMLLTDGMPNERPPRGEVDTLCRYLDSHPQQRAVKISTFGFGYSLMSGLLSDLARLGGSIYAFIPDSSFVGTIFINAVANLLSAASPRGATLKLEAAEGVKVVGCSSGHEFTATSWGATVQIPSILYGQAIDVSVELDGDSNHKVDPFRAVLELGGGLAEKPLEAQTETVDPLDPEDGVMRQAAVRAALITFIRTAEGVDKELRDRSNADLALAQQLLNNTKAEVAQLADGHGTAPPGIAAMRQDLDGQITEAYSTSAFYKKWGSHYALSLAGAHALQQCINFKDPGIQGYATLKFQALRDASEAIFLQLAPPKATRQVRVPVRSMRSYHCASAPCFAAGTVTLATGTALPIAQVQPGHVVKTRHGWATVECIVETPSKDGMENLVELDNGVLVTPWHPVRAAGSDKWVFPCFLAAPRLCPCECVYSFVLQDGATSIVIGSFDGIALGHGLTGDAVIEHDYLGTQRVVDDLKQMVGWSQGRVRLASNPAIRDQQGKGRIVGFRQANAAEEDSSARAAAVASAASAPIAVN